MTLEKALKLVQDNYNAAQKLDYIRNPLAFALYKVWKIADMQPKTNKGKVKDNGKKEAT